MPDTDQLLADRLREIFTRFEHDPEGSIDRLAALYDADVVFRDPLQTLRGRDAFLEMNRRILRRARRLGFTVTEAVGTRGSIFLAWTMTYEPQRAPTMHFTGATHARVQRGLIVEQRDYWDLLSTVAESVPGLRSVYRALAPHLG